MPNEQREAKNLLPEKWVWIDRKGRSPIHDVSNGYIITLESLAIEMAEAVVADPYTWDGKKLGETISRAEQLLKELKP